MRKTDPRHELYQSPNSTNKLTLRQIINRIKKLFPEDKVKMDACYHYVHGFIETTDGKFICIFSGDERYEDNIVSNMICRKAQSMSDHSGGRNNRFNLLTATRSEILRLCDIPADNSIRRTY